MEREPNKTKALPKRTAKLRVIPSNCIVHVVRNHETLVGIALAYNTQVSIIKKLNRIVGSQIYAGQQLLLPRSSKTLEEFKGKSLLNNLRSERLFCNKETKKHETNLQHEKKQHVASVYSKDAKQAPNTSAFTPTRRSRSSTFSGFTYPPLNSGRLFLHLLVLSHLCMPS